MSFPTPPPGPPGIQEPMPLRGGRFQALPDGRVVPAGQPPPPAAPTGFPTPPMPLPPDIAGAQRMAQMATLAGPQAAPTPPPGVAPPFTPSPSMVDRTAMSMPGGAARAWLRDAGINPMSPMGQFYLEQVGTGTPRNFSKDSPVGDLPTVFQLVAGGLDQPGGLQASPDEYNAFMMGYLETMRNPTPEAQRQVRQMREVLKAQVQAATTLPGTPLYNTVAQAVQQEGPQAYWDYIVRPSLVAVGVTPQYMRAKEREFEQKLAEYEEYSYRSSLSGLSAPSFQEYLAMTGYQGVDV